MGLLKNGVLQVLSSWENQTVLQCSFKKELLSVEFLLPLNLAKSDVVKHELRVERL